MTERQTLVGQIERPGQRPERVIFIGDELPTATDDEQAGGVTTVNSDYEPGNVLRYGNNTNPGVTDMSAAFQAAIDGLSTTLGGKVRVPAGTYVVGDVDILGSVFTNGGVEVDMDPRAVINVKSGSTYGIKIAGVSAASPMPFCVVRGGRIVDSIDNANYGLWLQNVTNWTLDNLKVFGVRSTSRSNASSGIFVQYSIYGTIINPQIQTCDYGLNIENDATNSFRQTTVNIFGGSLKTCYRAMRVDDGLGINAYGTAFENSSIGVLYDYSRTTGLNSFSCNLFACYFERNGLHVKTTEHGTAVCRGINMHGCFFENVTTTYIGGVAFEDSGSGDYKVDLDGQNHNVEWCYWSTAPAVSSVIIQSGATRNRIGPQHTTTGFAVTDNGTSTIKDYTDPIASGSAVTVSGIHRHSADLRVENAIKIAGLNNAGSAWRDLLHITASDVAVFGNVTTSSDVYSASQPRWYNGSAFERLASSDGDTGGSGSAGAGNQYVELNINGTTYKVLHDGTV